MYRYNEDAAFERLKDVQREMENSRLIAERTVDLLGLFAQPIVALVEMAIAALRPLPSARPMQECGADAGSDAA